MKNRNWSLLTTFAIFFVVAGFLLMLVGVGLRDVATRQQNKQRDQIRFCKTLSTPTDQIRCLERAALEN